MTLPLINWNEYVLNRQYEKLENDILNIELSPETLKKKQLDKIHKISRSLKERLLYFYLSEGLYQSFLEFYEKLEDSLKYEENILTQLLECYYHLNDITNMKNILERLNPIKHRHLVRIIEYQCNNNELDQVFTQIFLKYYNILDEKDFTLFFNICIEKNRIDYIKIILNLINQKNIVFISLDNEFLLGEKYPIYNCNIPLRYKNIDCSIFIDKLINNSNQQEQKQQKYNNFISFLKKNKYNYDIVIDVANVLYSVLPKKLDNISPNEISLDFLETILNNLINKLNFHNPLLIIHERYRKIIGDRFTTKYFIYWTPPRFNDDDFILIASWLKYPIPFLTNDLFSDHIFFQSSNKDIEQWYNDMVVHYKPNGFIIRNNSYSHIIQKVDDNHWHIPIIDKNGKKNFICFQDK